jgi:transposase
MRDHVSRLVGLEGFEVKWVIEVGDRLDLEVELVARAGCCPRCGRGSVDVKERPVVRVRDLPIAGRATHLVWRKRRYGCRGCGRSFTGDASGAAGAPAGDAALPAAAVRAGARRGGARRGGAL